MLCAGVHGQTSARARALPIASFTPHKLAPNPNELSVLCITFPSAEKNAFQSSFQDDFFHEGQKQSKLSTTTARLEPTRANPINYLFYA